MRGTVNAYVRHAGWIGVAFCAVPALAWFGLMVATMPFRGVYALRLALCLVVGGAVAARVNRCGVDLWIAKHRGPTGPATVGDGALVGAGVGLGIALLPTLTALIQTNHPELAKTFVIATYLGSAALGALIGSVFAAVGRDALSTGPADAETK